MEASFVEIYNESLRDLLVPAGKDTQKLCIKLQGSDVYVTNLTLVTVTNEAQVRGGVLCILQCVIVHDHPPPLILFML